MQVVKAQALKLLNITPGQKKRLGGGGGGGGR